MMLTCEKYLHRVILLNFWLGINMASHVVKNRRKHLIKVLFVYFFLTNCAFNYGTIVCLMDYGAPCKAFKRSNRFSCGHLPILFERFLCAYTTCWQATIRIRKVIKRNILSYERVRLARLIHVLTCFHIFIKYRGIVIFAF